LAAWLFFWHEKHNPAAAFARGRKRRGERDLARVGAAHFLAFTKLAVLGTIPRPIRPLTSGRGHLQFGRQRDGCGAAGHGRPLTQQGVLDVRINLPWATFVAGILAIVVSPALVHAQAPPPQSGPSVVVIDVSRVFKEHIRFKQQLDVMKTDVEGFEGYIRQQRKVLTDLAEEVKRYNVGSPEYKQNEEKMARLTSDLQVQTQLKRNEFMDREAKIYYNTYVEVSKSVSDFAMRSGIRLVLRYNSEDIDPTKRDSVLAGVNNAIVFQHKLDITDLIIGELNKGSLRQADRPDPTRPVLPPRN
jgi:Skp family chaperone for outer membrane proteins